MLITKEAPRQLNLNFQQITEYLSRVYNSIAFFAKKRPVQKSTQRIIEIAGGCGDGTSKKSKWKKRQEERKRNKRK